MTRSEQAELLDDLNYLNLGEIRSFCRKHSIPYKISIELKDGRRKRTNEDDRKGVVLDRIRHFLETGEILRGTCFPANVVCFDLPLDSPAPADRLFYGQYDKANRGMIRLLKELTGGQFRHGAIARILARDFWARGKAPTFREFAETWLAASADHTAPNPEWAFLSDRARKADIPNWKEFRAAKARRALKRLNLIQPKSR